MNGNNQKKKQYVSVEDVAVKWEVTPETVRKYCRSGKIKNAIKKDGKWYISTDETKPLRDCDIKNLLKLAQQLQNNPELETGWDMTEEFQAGLDIAYKNLSVRGYISKFKAEKKDKIPYEIKLSKEGMKIAPKFKETSAKHFLEFASICSSICLNAFKFYLLSKGM